MGLTENHIRYGIDHPIHQSSHDKAVVELSEYEGAQTLTDLSLADGAAVLGLFDALAILGKESCLARIDRALAMVDHRTD